MAEAAVVGAPVGDPPASHQNKLTTFGGVYGEKPQVVVASEARVYQKILENIKIGGRPATS